MVGGGDDQLWGSGRGAFDNTIFVLLSGVYAGIICFFCSFVFEKSARKRSLQDSFDCLLRTFFPPIRWGPGVVPNQLPLFSCAGSSHEGLGTCRISFACLGGWDLEVNSYTWFAGDSAGCFPVPTISTKNIKKPLRIGILPLEKTEHIDFVTLCFEDDHIFPDVGPALRFLRRWMDEQDERTRSS